MFGIVDLDGLLMAINKRVIMFCIVDLDGLLMAINKSFFSKRDGYYQIVLACILKRGQRCRGGGHYVLPMSVQPSVYIMQWCPLNN